MTISEFLHLAKPPWLSILNAGDDESLRAFLASGFPDIYVGWVDGRNCRTKSDLMTEFARKLNFPSYFGRNWDAFEDCLEDLEWLPLNQLCGGYAIVVTDAEQLLTESSVDYGTFVDIVKSVGAHWATPSSDGSDRASVPFHALLLPARSRGSSRDWGVPELDVQLPPITPQA